MSETLRFSVKLKSIPVELETEEGVNNYTLWEMTGEQKDSYLDTMKDRFQVKGEEVVAIASFKGYEASLLSICLKTESGGEVSKKDIQALPATVREQLHQAAQDLNGLSKKGSADIKKN